MLPLFPRLYGGGKPSLKYIGHECTETIFYISFQCEMSMPLLPIYQGHSVHKG